METVEYKNISFTVWDVGGQDKVKILILMHPLKYKIFSAYITYLSLQNSTTLLEEICWQSVAEYLCLLCRFVPCGGTTSKIHRVSFLLLTAMTGTELLRPEMSCTGC